jgi:hypothetical protein
MNKVTSIIIDLNEEIGSVDISFKLDGSAEYYCSREFEPGSGTKKTLEVLEDRIQKFVKDRIVRQALWQKE